MFKIGILTAEQEEFKEKVNKFVQECVEPYAEEHDLEQHLNENVIQALAKEGYLGAVVQKRYGGMELDNMKVALLNEEVGKSCSSTRSLLTVHGMVELAIQRWGNKEQRETYLGPLARGEYIASFALTEPNVGSDAKSIETIGTIDGNFCTINGTKMWITLGQYSKLFLVFVSIDGKPTSILVERDTPGFEIEEMKDLTGARGSMIAKLNFNDCKVSVKNIVGGIGNGISYVAMTCLDYGRFTIAASCVGAAQRCLEESVAYSRTRKQFGATIRKNQLIQKMICEMAVNVEAARMLCYNAAILKEDLDEKSIIETWNAKYFATNMLQKVVLDAVQIHGAIGCRQGSVVERCFRDAKINTIIEGTNQMHELLIGINAMKLY